MSKTIKLLAEGFVSDAKITRLYGAVPNQCWVDGCDDPAKRFVILNDHIFFLCKDHYDDFLTTSANMLCAKARKEAGDV